MAQLLKLSDYVSRYEIDMYRYPSRYVRLKKERWTRLKQDFDATRKGLDSLPLYHQYEEEDSLFKKAINRFRKKKTEDNIPLPTNENLRHKTLDELKLSFKEELFQFQLNWASSTVSEISPIKRAYEFDTLLQFLVKELPDTFFIMYEPVLYARKAPVEMDILIISPTDIWLLVPLKGSKDAIFTIESDRYWTKQENGVVEKFLHPSIRLKRMRTVLEQILEDVDHTLTIRQGIIAKDSFIDLPQASQRVQLIDKRTIQRFRQTLLKNQSPIKNAQLKVSDKLLMHSMTVSQSRLQEEIGEDTVENEGDIR
ncbi:hypothetical protein FLK61_36215 [Paenalkalicoccus suaedae]|uniref:NERD domain-containing protein n=1 Tax=Paenalkalicoccus suaedae TaxID=2592382 RepID=A0A859FH10_9BACI|nr:hypothetical protein [Paenalkalicoccus suaedae]QKS72108.1 hypothetical protein FLK61_36215 [Paenalkalicoccus suaedae]